MAKIKISYQVANVGGWEGETILVTEHLIIYVCGESRRKHGAVIRITAPKGMYPYKGGFLQFARKTKARFTNLIENEIASL